MQGAGRRATNHAASEAYPRTAALLVALASGWWPRLTLVATAVSLALSVLGWPRFDVGVPIGLAIIVPIALGITTGSGDQPDDPQPYLGTMAMSQPVMALAARSPEITAASTQPALKPESVQSPARYRLSNPEPPGGRRKRAVPFFEST